MTAGRRLAIKKVFSPILTPELWRRLQLNQQPRTAGGMQDSGSTKPQQLQGDFQEERKKGGKHRVL